MRIDTFSSHLSPAEAERIAREFFGLAGMLVRLPGEYDDNFRLTLADGSSRVLKVMHPERTAAFVDLQTAALGWLADRAPELDLPRVVPTSTGAPFAPVETECGSRLAWMLGWVPGRPLAELPSRSPALLASLGRLLGRVDRALDGFEHPELDRVSRWDLVRAGWIRDRLDAIAEPARRALVLAAIDRFDEIAAPALAVLPKVAIHGDANDWNVLVRVPREGAPGAHEAVSLIDFGDMVRSPRICDLAIGAAYALFDAPPPNAALAALAHVVAGFDDVAPLLEAEIEILPALVAARLSVSVTNAAIRRALAPDDPYVSVSEAPAWAALEALAAIPERLAVATLRAACGLAPSPAAGRTVAEFESLPLAPVLAPPLLDRLTAARTVDLSVGSLLLGADPANLAPAGVRAAVERALGTGDDAPIGLGLYGEARLLGPISLTPGAEPASIHLGVDLFLPTGSEVLAPLPGVVAEIADTEAGPRVVVDLTPSVPLSSPAREATRPGEGDAPSRSAGADPTAPGDAGGGAPLPDGGLLGRSGEGSGMRPSAAPLLRTLWLGLARESLPPVGATVAAGALLGRVADPQGNGGLPPHIHVQALADDLGLGARFPTACRPSERAVWQALSVDPTWLLGVPLERIPPPRRTLDELLAARRARIGRNLSISYSRPLEIVRGWRQHLFDAEGRAYLDVYNNVAHVGHQHPRVVEAIRAQVGLLNTNTRYLHANLIRYAERLAGKMPAPLSVVFVVNSASEANELALRLARAATGSRELIVLEAAYHGHTTSLIDASPYKHAGPGGAGAPAWVHTAPIPDDYRGAWKRGDPQAGARYARAVQEIVERLPGPATFLAESLPSVGGQIVPPPGYLDAVYRAVRGRGGVVIADEVQTGFGRLGSAFWGFELQGVVPDIVVLGKPIGNGHPLGAVVTTPAIAAAFDNGMEFFSTFGGNPVACAAGLAVLDVVEDERLQENAWRIGERLLADLRAVAARHTIVGDVRGAGFFLGLELVRDRETLAPAAREASAVVDRLRDLGVLAGTDGPLHNVIKLRPQMIFTAADADFLIDRLDRALGELAAS